MIQAWKTTSERANFVMDDGCKGFYGTCFVYFLSVAVVLSQYF